MSALFFYPNRAARYVATLLLGVAMLVVAAPASAATGCGALQVTQARVHVMPAAPVAGGFFRLHNGGDGSITIKAVTSPQFKRVHMHESRIDDSGMASMTPVDSVTVAAGQTLSFAPGGYHLMLFQPQQALAPGDHVMLELHCADSEDTLAVTAVVRSKMDMGHKHQASGHDGHASMPHGKHGQ